MSEAEAQILFHFNMGCLPVGIILLIIGFSKRGIKRIFLFVGSIAISQFIWYFKTLGISLTARTGSGISYPKWWLHIVVGASIGIIITIAVTNLRLLKNKVTEDEESS